MMRQTELEDSGATEPVPGGASAGAPPSEEQGSVKGITNLLRLRALHVLLVEASLDTEQSKSPMPLNDAKQLLGSAALVRAWLSQGDVKDKTPSPSGNVYLLDGERIEIPG